MTGRSQVDLTIVRETRSYFFRRKRFLALVAVQANGEIMGYARIWCVLRRRCHWTCFRRASFPSRYRRHAMNFFCSGKFAVINTAIEGVDCAADNSWVAGAAPASVALASGTRAVRRGHPRHL